MISHRVKSFLYGIFGSRLPRVDVPAHQLHYYTKFIHNDIDPYIMKPLEWFNNPELVQWLRGIPHHIAMDDYDRAQPKFTIIFHRDADAVMYRLRY
jgi:hypothetical protein